MMKQKTLKKIGIKSIALLLALSFSVCSADEEDYINSQLEVEEAPLMKASEKGDANKIKQLLATGAKVDLRGGFGMTALMSASYKGKVDAVRILIAAGANVNAKSAYGETALGLASMRGHADVVRILIAEKADVNVKGDAGTTPLFNARFHHHDDVVTLLEQAGGHD